MSKTYNQVTIYQDERGKSLVIPGKDTGKIEYGPQDKPIRAESKEVLNLPEKMSEEETQKWIERHSENEDSVLHSKLEKYSESSDGEGDTQSD